MQQFQKLLFDVLNNGHLKRDRTGVGTRSLFGYQMRFNLEEGFPICTTKKVPFNAVLSELLWFISGSTNVNDLRGLLYGESNRDNWGLSTIWDANASAQGQALGYEDGELGPVYGKQWRSWPTNASWEGQQVHIDQLGQVIEQIKSNPDSRRLIVSAWNVAEIDAMALPPCHCLFQFYVNDGKLSCQLYQRSADVFLGVPFNIASYALLTHIIARMCNLGIGEFIWTGGDVHLYNTHVEQAQTMLGRIPTLLPTLVITGEQKSIDDFVMNDFTLLGYNPAPTIKADMAV